MSKNHPLQKWNRHTHPTFILFSVHCPCFIKTRQSLQLHLCLLVRCFQTSHQSSIFVPRTVVYNQYAILGFIPQFFYIISGQCLVKPCLYADFFHHLSFQYFISLDKVKASSFRRVLLVVDSSSCGRFEVCFLRVYV